MAARTAAEALTYIAETRYALERIFETLEQRQGALTEIAEEVERIDDAKERHHGIFVDRDQWSPHANWHYIKLRERLEELEERRRQLLDDRGR